MVNWYVNIPVPYASRSAKRIGTYKGNQNFRCSFFHPAEQGDFLVAWLQDVGVSLEMLDVFGCFVGIDRVAVRVDKKKRVVRVCTGRIFLDSKHNCFKW